MIFGDALAAQFRVWPGRGVIVPLGGQHETGMGQRGDLGHVEAFVAQEAGAALRKAVLHRQARRLRPA